MYGNYRLTAKVRPEYVEKYGREVKATSDATTQDIINKLYEYEEIGSVDEFKTLKDAFSALEDDKR